MNGDRYKGMYLDGRPNGIGDMLYKQSVVLDKNTVETAQYIGNFSAGKREGKGSMYWQDGSNFKGHWLNDQRLHGKMIMANGIVYEGGFKND